TGAAPAAPNGAADAATPAATDFEGLLEHFHRELAPHGAWIEHPELGSVWIPNETEVGKSFTPYRTDGRWAVTDHGKWAWVSNFDWGRIPFHYGRWAWTKDKSWAWVPDREYAPAWVVWRLGQPGTDFVGWAPMPPSHVYKGGQRKALVTGVLPFNFVPTHHLFRPNLDRHLVTDPRIGAEIQRHSNIFASHFKEGRDGFVPGVATTPDFDEAHIPDNAIPATRLPSTAKPVAPIVLAALQTEEEPAAAPEGFATPPEAKRDQPASGGSASGEGEGDAPERVQLPDDARRHGVHTTKRRKYRCWWTNTRPRVWRCGY
ncbi:MAG: hypothetical protein KC731_33000, partial [Myxococcales bacterium]|nr:hypothetical protein [Myxococcales bacterium]